MRGLWGVVALVVVALLPAAPASAAVTEPAQAEVELLRISQVIGPDDELGALVRVRNTGSQAIDSARVSLRLVRQGFISRSSLAIWEEAEAGDRMGAEIAFTMAEQLAPGEQRDVYLSAPARELGLPVGAQEWGARGIVAQVRDGSQTLAAARSFVIWLPSEQPPTTRLSVIAPIVAAEPDARTTLDGAASALIDQLGEDGRLGRLLTAASATAVSWAVDPALIGAAEGVGEAGAAWLEELSVASRGRDVFALPYADPDLGALARADATELLGAAGDLGADELAALFPDGLRSDLAWPADTLDRDTVDFLASTGTTAVVVGPDELAPAATLTYTPTGRTTVEAAGSGGSLSALIPDETLSDLLTSTGTTTAVAVQRLLAETAVITRERPSDPRSLLAALPRDWSPDPDTVRAQLAALDAAPWLDLVPVSTLLGTPDPQVDRVRLPVTAASAAEIQPGLVEALTSARHRLQAVDSVVASDQPVSAELPTALLGPLSVAWRSDPAGRALLTDAVVGRVEELHAAIGVLDSSAVTLVSTSGELPLRVRNDLALPVTVHVELDADTPLLQVTEPVVVTIPADSEQSIRVPVQGLKNGDVDLTVQLTDDEAAAVGVPQTLTVRVRADWENMGTMIIGGLLGLGLVIGLVRNIRQGRRTRQAAAAAALAPSETMPAAPRGTA